jgi:hypothetical protein
VKWGHWSLVYIFLLLSSDFSSTPIHFLSTQQNSLLLPLHFEFFFFFSLCTTNSFTYFTTFLLFFTSHFFPCRIFFAFVIMNQHDIKFLFSLFSHYPLKFFLIHRLYQVLQWLSIGTGEMMDDGLLLIGWRLTKGVMMVREKGLQV